MAEFSYAQMVKNLANDALDNFLYKGKTIREWADLLHELKLPDLDKATNGDVIKALFPIEQIKHIENSHVSVTFSGGDISQDYLLDWWNAPYKKEGDKECI